MQTTQTSIKTETAQIHLTEKNSQLFISILDSSKVDDLTII